MVKFSFKEQYDISDLVEIVRLLRAPGGCPWDREQDHHSIRKNLIEEAYEVAEAIDMESVPMLREELGDLLLQVVLHAQMEAEKGAFSFSDVCNEICQKLIVRHPHVFGDVRAESTGEVLNNWDAIKQQTKGQTTVAQTLESVPRTLPALMRAEKVQHRAAKAGLGESSVPGALSSLQGEVERLHAALEAGPGAGEELGGVLFAAVQAARQLGRDPEELLSASTDRFIRQAKRTEELAAQQGLTLKDCTAEQLDVCWRQAKDNISVTQQEPSAIGMGTVDKA
ncbi:MAG: nucleoside triphosphate pyrophosphohydrolase [Provencibacterium sp.]|nr:nucleoside triphosphate pyrophosphohydrolase [Provencibacterium sp.]